MAVVGPPFWQAGYWVDDYWAEGFWISEAAPGAVDNTKLAFMEWCQVWEPGLPVSPGALGQDDKQQLLWGAPTPLWEEEAGGPAASPGGPLNDVTGITVIAGIS